MKVVIHTNDAPQAIGPYSQAIKTDNFVFTSGQIAIDPKDNTLISGDIKQQTRQVLENLKAVLEACGTGLKNVVKTTVYLTDMNEFVQMNEIYGQYFYNQPPARTTVEVSNLPKNAKIEIDAIALIE